MEEFTTYEYAVKQKIEGKWKFRRFAMFALYVFFVIGWFAFGFATNLFPLLALIPVTLWMLVFFTWRYVSVEYEYSVTSGILTFSKIYGGRSRKKFFEVPLREATIIAPLTDQEKRNHAELSKPEREFEGISSYSAPEVWFMTFELTEGKEKRRAIYYFEPTERMLHLCRYYNPSATVREVKKL